tara:strand:+ start:203 stop:409 length:207 start_codon:yes stop_codon:yes gene_type:complete
MVAFACRGSVMLVAESGSEFRIEFVATFKPDTAFLARHRAEPKLKNSVNFAYTFFIPLATSSACVKLY